MKTRLVVSVLLATLALGIGIGAAWHRWTAHAGHSAHPASEDRLWTCAMHPQVLQKKPGTCPICGMKLTPVRAESKSTAASGDRKVKYYWDPMLNPPYISSQPGKSPMGMDLIPVYEDEVRAGPAVTIDPVVTQNIGIRVAPVEQGPLSVTVRNVGYLREAEPLQHDFSLKFGGWVERLYADTEGMLLRKGSPLLEIYSPELLVAQEDLLTAKRAFARLPAEADERLRQDTARLIESSRRKLSLWDVPEATLERILAEGVARPRVTFESPSDGFLLEKGIVQGSAIVAGQKLFRIVDHGTLWLDVQVYESQLSYLTLGMNARATVSGIPNREFEGKLVYLAPTVSPVTRTAVARLSFPNPDLTLRPGMYAHVELTATLSGQALTVPREAVIDTGVRQVAFVAGNEGRFEARRVRIGVEGGDGRIQILAGLAPGERVVTSGQFLLDAESRMREAIEKLSGKKLLQPPALDSKPLVSAPESPAARVAAAGDDAVLSYLEMVQLLADDRVVSESLVDRLSGEIQRMVDAGELPRDLASTLVKAASSVRTASIADQRKGFKDLSLAMIAMVGHRPPSPSVAAKLYVLNCGMVRADWLQATEEVSNPFAGKEMFGCGEVLRTIEAR